ncbi:arylalkylamine N-acetyltransferase 1 [Bactrocera neohumeralis]|uniref:dopamine N-acetyltransferase n=1 Tax=Bactrocera tryoni TaxID=59916 RepID=UPI001A99B9D7|nr:dopamine N-acetyltransferase [Bactrocera tryoni]XP_050331888.1 arylalkylamine N-acetyltransferase 1 [Bactrocera neohumeralis]
MEYKLITEDRFDDVVAHLSTNFFADEPLNKAAGLCRRGEGHRELEQLCYETLKDNLSLMAVNENNDIAGVLLNGVVYPQDILQAHERIELSDDERYKKIFRLLNEHNLRANIFGNFNVARAFEVRMLSVDGRFRGQGIAKELVRRSETIARDFEFKLMKADATGIFSQKILKSNGFKVLSEFYYDKYTDEFGKPILLVEAPHIKLQLLYKLLE